MGSTDGEHASQSVSFGAGQDGKTQEGAVMVSLTSQCDISVKLLASSN